MAPQGKASRSREEADDSLAGESTQPNQNDLTAELVSTDADEWAATAEGYTPLADLGAGEAMFMAFPPSMDDDDENDPSGGGGVFFADLRAFGTSAIEQIEDGARQDTGAAVEEQPVTDEPTDFRILADQALSSLENEYAMTLRGDRTSFTAEDSVATNSSPGTPDEVLPGAGGDDVPPNPSLSAFVERELPPIDADAVRRAVQSIRLKAPDLTTNLDKGSEKQKENAVAPKEHPLIPSTPLAAFRRQSPKAFRATANLSRSATLAETLCRLSCLGSSKESLVIHVVGADPVECESDERVRTLFGPLVRWVGAFSQAPTHIVILLIGPDLPSNATLLPPVNLMPSSVSTQQPTTRLESASASFFSGCYHEWISQVSESTNWQKPDVAVAFNAGIWGYNKWHPTLEALFNEEEAVPFVITSYTIQEAEDDADVVEELIDREYNSKAAGAKQNMNKGRCLWGPEANPYGSKVIRETAGAIEGREYRENAVWQAWLLGGKDGHTLELPA